MLDEKPLDFVCSEFSSENEESMLGSAPERRVWFLVEYDKAWGYDAVAESRLSDELKQHLLEAVETTAPAETLFIKQSKADPNDRKAFYVAVTDEAPRLYKIPIGDYESLLDLDLAGIVKGEGFYERFRIEDEIWLVCTNGLRDKCCAQHGVAVYEKMLASIGEKAWQSSHVGGHRFAANVAHLPSGILYGRIRTQDVPQLLAQNGEGHMLHGNLRGRTGYPKAVQAAEGLLREIKPSLGIDALRLVSVTSQDEDSWLVHFAEEESGIGHELTVFRRDTSEPVYVACRGEKLKPMVKYELLQHKIV